MPLIVQVKSLTTTPAVIEGSILPENIGLTEEDYIQFVEPIAVKSKVYLAGDTVIADVEVKGRFKAYDYRSLDDLEKDWKINFIIDFPIEYETEKIDMEEDIRQEIIMNLPLRVLQNESQQDEPTIVPFVEENNIEEEDEPKTHRPFEDL